MRMREIKFRAWDEKKKAMLHTAIPNSCDYLNFAIGDVTNKHKMELMQFTGMRDKNDKEIFEGDIVEFWDIPWNTGGMGAERRRVVVNFKEGNFTTFAASLEPEIIGNIHENAVEESGVVPNGRNGS